MRANLCYVGKHVLLRVLVMSQNILEFFTCIGGDGFNLRICAELALSVDLKKRKEKQKKLVIILRIYIFFLLIDWALLTSILVGLWNFQ